MLTTCDRTNDPLWLVSTDAGVGVMKNVGISKVEVTLVSTTINTNYTYFIEV